MSLQIKKIKLPKQFNSNNKYSIMAIPILLAFILIAGFPILVHAQTDNSSGATKTLRIGYFPNINHAQAVIGLNNGDFQKILGNDIKIQPFVFNAGPSATEALLAKRIDVSFVGPNPAINGYVVTGGKDIRVISGVTSGGASFIVRDDAGINSVHDLGGKKFASPQLGNTQDVALRKYLIDNGFNTVDKGGNVTVLTVSPSNILTLFLKKEIDGAWVPEPWGAHLIKEAHGKIFVDERSLWPPNGEFVTANIVVRTNYLKDNPDIVKKLLEAHVNETNWINNILSKYNNTDNNQIVNAFNNGLKQITGKTIPIDELTDAISRIKFTYNPLSETLIKMAEDAKSLGYINNGKDNNLNLSKIYDLNLLKEVVNGNKQTMLR